MLPIARIFVSPTGRMPLCRGRAAIPASSRASSPTQHRESHSRSNNGRSSRSARIEADLAIRPGQGPGSDRRVVAAINRPASRRRQPLRTIADGTGLVNRGTPCGRNSPRPSRVVPEPLARKPRVSPPRAQSQGLGSDRGMVLATNPPSDRRRQPLRKVPGGTGLVNRGTPGGRNGPKPSSVGPKPRVSPPRARRPRRPARSLATRWCCLMAAMLRHAPARPGVRSRCGSRPQSFESAPREAAEPITARGVRRAAEAGHVAAVVTVETTTEEGGIASAGFVWPIFFPIRPGPKFSVGAGPLFFGGT